MARQKSTIRHNPLAGLAAASPVDPGDAEHIVPSADKPAVAEADVAPDPVTPTRETAPAEAMTYDMDEPDPAETEEDPEPWLDDGARARFKRAQGVVRRYAALSAVAGLLPVPVIDVATAAAVQVKMLHAIARLYGVPFNAHLARQLVLATIGGGGSAFLAVPAASVAKSVPVVGTVASVLLSPAFTSVSCYATGRSFIRHFQAGGTLETFDPAKAKAPAA